MGRECSRLIRFFTLQKIKCAACQFGKQINRSKPGKGSSAIKDKIGSLSSKQLQPGQRVFVDHFECPARGQKFSGQGIKNIQQKATIKDKNKSYGYGCIFIDAATGFINIQLQSFVNVTATIQSVKQFENDAKDHGIIIKEYHSDNGSVFTSQDLRQYLMDNNQTCRFGEQAVIIKMEELNKVSEPSWQWRKR